MQKIANNYLIPKKNNCLRDLLHQIIEKRQSNEISVRYWNKSLPEAVQKWISLKETPCYVKSQFEYLLILEQTLLLYDFGTQWHHNVKRGLFGAFLSRMAGTT